jgi:hypothetical protein
LDTTNPENNERFSKDLFAFFKEKLNIPDTRGYIIFTDPGRGYWGCVVISRLPTVPFLNILNRYRSSTVAKLMG